MMANGLQEWLKRYWLWILLIGAMVIFALTCLFPSTKDKTNILNETKEKAKKLKDELAQEHKVIAEEMEARTNELIEIKAISDEDERLKRLAEFANRRRS